MSDIPSPLPLWPDPAEHVLRSGPRFRGQTVLAIARTDEGRGYLTWLNRGGGDLWPEDRQAVHDYLRQIKDRKKRPQPEETTR
jgi:hypothetical protein